MSGQVFIIAEAGVNHNGNIDLAYKLIEKAKETGADAIKFQTFKTEKILSKQVEMADYQERNLGIKESQFAMIKKLELSYDQFCSIKNYCDQIGIMFLSTPDEQESLDFLTGKLNIPIIKIGSGEVNNIPYLKQIAQKNRPIILSTGMADIAEIDEAVEIIQKNQNCENNYFPALNLLHCTTNYPTLYEEVNLKAMVVLRETFKLPVGYSDHTFGIEISIAAVTLGASIIEKHFTLDKSLPGPDHRASLEPHELRAMVEAIRNVEKAFGDGIKKPTSNEAKIMPLVRKSLITTRSLPKGHILKEDDIIIKRPGTGIAPKFKDVIVGMRITKDMAEEEPIKWSFLQENQ